MTAKILLGMLAGAALTVAVLKWPDKPWVLACGVLATMALIMAGVLPE